MTSIIIDHSGFYLDGKPFVPLIAEGTPTDVHNSVLICLSAQADHELDWSEQGLFAKKMLEEKKMIFWQIDLGLTSHKVFFDDTGLFHSATIALEEFTKKIYSQFKDKTLGLCIYKGPLDFSKRALWNEKINSHFQEWLLDRFKTPLQFTNETGFECSDFRDLEIEQMSNIDTTSYLLDVFCTNLLIEYLHRLGSFLPDDLPIFCLLELNSYKSVAKLAHLLSKERFAHLLLGLKHAQVPLGNLTWETGKATKGWIGKEQISTFETEEISIGVCFPNEEHFRLSMIDTFDRLFFEMEGLSISYRLIAEEFLTEQWDGIETLIVFSGGLSPQGKRKLQGFCAAGGNVVTCGDKIGLVDEISFEEYISERKKSE